MQTQMKVTKQELVDLARDAGIRYYYDYKNVILQRGLILS